MPLAYNEFKFRSWPQFVGEGAGWGIVYIRHWLRDCDFVKGAGPAPSGCLSIFTKPDQRLATKLPAAGTGFGRLQLKCDGTRWRREGKWRGNWRMEWIGSTLHTTSEHDVSSITSADAHTSAASSRLNWRPRRFKWTHSFRRKTKSDFCACAITFQLACTHFY